MWHPRTDSLSRGGFQNRDVGYSSSDDDYGPDYGIDYARFSDVPNYQEDNSLRDKIERKIEKIIPGFDKNFSLLVRNGFIFIKTSLDKKFRDSMKSSILSMNGVRDVIVQEVL